MPQTFTLSTRVSDVLEARPDLRTILPAFHPMFERLSHPMLGRILPKLVSVADAARVAGVDPEALLAVMNLPPTSPPPGPAQSVSPTDEPTPVWLDRGPVTELDVRPFLAAGEDPFARILQATRGLAPGEVLTVLAPFEPAPLLRFYSERGWYTHVTWRDGACRASFWFAPTASGVPEPVATTLASRVSSGTEGPILDVRGLEAPEPLRLVMAALDDPALRPETGRPLTVHHERAPALLYPRLTERGLLWSTDAQEGLVKIRIHVA